MIQRDTSLYYFVFICVLESESEDDKGKGPVFSFVYTRSFAVCLVMSIIISTRVIIS